MKNLRLFFMIVLCATGISSFAQQPYYLHITTNAEPTIEDNYTYYDVCIGDTITMVATAEFTQTPDDSIPDRMYEWFKIDGKIVPYSGFDTTYLDSGRIFDYAFEEGGIYFIVCKSLAVSGLAISNSLVFRVSMPPSISASASRQYICYDTEVELNAETPEQETWKAFIYSPTMPAHKFIGVGETSYVSVYNPIGGYGRGDTVRSVDDIDHVSINIEHSFLGDLDFMLECPTGKKCLLHAYTSSSAQEIFVSSTYNWTNTGGVYLEGSKGGGIAHLGIAVDPNSSGSSCFYDIGEGYVYNIYSNGTMPFGAGSPKELITHTDDCNNTYNDSVVMQEQNYGPYESMESLIGCPLNGIWKLYIMDYGSIDNGYWFEWGLFFNENIPYNPWSFTTTYDVSTASWSGDVVTSGEQGSLTATAWVSAANESPVPYTFSITDNYGCTHSSTVDVNIGSGAMIPEIGIATVNTRNQVVLSWLPIIGDNTQAYRVYLERNSQWLLAAEIPAEDSCYWIDESVDPSEQSYSYRLTSVNDCGESQMSDIMQTLLLSVNSNDNGEWVLSWSQSEVSSSDICIIYRGVSPVALEAIDTVPANQYSYTDTTAVENAGYFYQIEIIRNTRSIVTQRSNIIGNGLTVTFTINAIPESDTLGTVSGSGNYYAFEKVTIFAEPANGYHFVSWDDGNTENPREITVLCDSTFVALFAEGNPLYTINVRSADPIMGEVSGSGTYEAGTTARLEAYPNSNYHFDHWSDGSTDNPHDIVVTMDATYIGFFAVETNMDEFFNSNIILYPNPTESVINISSEVAMSKVELISVTGQILFKANVDGYDVAFDVKHLEPGLYFVQIIGINNEHIGMLKFIKE